MKNLNLNNSWVAKFLQANIICLYHVNKNRISKAFKLSLTILFFLILMPDNLAAQSTIQSNNNGSWNSAGTWVGGIVPTATDNVVINHTDTIHSGTTAECFDLTINADGNLVVYGTLIVHNDLTMNFVGNNESEFEIKPNSVVVVKRDVYLTTKISLNLSSYFIVLGNLNAQSLSQNTNINIDDASIYVFGSVDQALNLNSCDSYNGLTENNNQTCHVGTNTAFETNTDNGTVPPEIVDLAYTCTAPEINFLNTDAIVCSGEEHASLYYLNSSGNPDIYSIEFSSSAVDEGFLNVIDQSIPIDQIDIDFPVNATPGIYNAELTVKNSTTGCSSETYDITVTINESPNNTPTGFSGSTICAGEDGILSFDAVNSTFATPYTIEYTDGTNTWQQEITTDAEFEFNVSVDPNVTTTYTLVSVTNGNGCKRITGFGDATAQIIVNEPPAISFFSTNTLSCVGQVSAYIFYFNPTGNPDTYSIEYSPSALNSGFRNVMDKRLRSSNTFISTISTRIPKNVSSGIYHAELTVKNSTTGCASNIYNITFTINELPNNTSTGFSGNTICAGEEGILTFDAVNSTFATPYTIEYTDGTNTWQQEITTDAEFEFNVAVNPNVTTTYTLVSIFSGNPCSRTSDFGDATAQIIVNEIPEVNLLNTDAIACSGDVQAYLYHLNTIGNADTYSIRFSSPAVDEGFSNVIDQSIPIDQIDIDLPVNATPGIYNAELTVKNSTTGCSSENYDITVTIAPTPATGEITPD